MVFFCAAGASQPPSHPKKRRRLSSSSFLFLISFLRERRFSHFLPFHPFGNPLPQRLFGRRRGKKPRLPIQTFTQFFLGQNRLLCKKPRANPDVYASQEIAFCRTSPAFVFSKPLAHAGLRTNRLLCKSEEAERGDPDVYASLGPLFTPSQMPKMAPEPSTGEKKDVYASPLSRFGFALHKSRFSKKALFHSQETGCELLTQPHGRELAHFAPEEIQPFMQE